MNPAQLQILKGLINSDPALSSKPMTSAAAHEIAQELNTPTEPGFGPITVSQAMLWAANGPRVRIGAASTDPQKSESIRASCLIFLDLLNSGTGQQISTQNPSVKQLFEAWLTDGVITAAEYGAVYGESGIAATVLPKSVAAIGELVTSADVQEARELP